MLHEITDKIEWTKLHEARTIPSGHFLQSWEWGEFQISLGRKVYRFADDKLLAQVVELPLPLGKKYWFCPKGPIVTKDERRMMNDEFIDELKKNAKEAGVVFLRIEPSSGGVELGSMKQSPHDINPRATSIIDLSKTDDELLAAMHPKTRYNIRVSEKHGVEVCSSFIVHRSFDSFWKLFEETAKRDGFRLHPREYYEKQIKMSDVEVYGAEYESKLLAAAIVIFSGDSATYLHGASSNEMRNVMAPYALHWAIMKQAKVRGVKHYDLWGISDDPKSGWAGITRFKRGFGGADVSAPGTFDLPVNKFWYSVYALVRRMRP
jgi:lipid II:glycine glycyltransferase (peptidoglycan interpeptide bridge formation enzyme)